MGIDLIGSGRSYNWGAWHDFFELGLAFGWQPKGTLRPRDFEGEWHGGYFSNDCQIVSADDAAAWSDALMKYLAAPEENIPDKFNPQRHRSSPLPPFVFDPEETIRKEREFIEDFARVLARGEIILG